MNVDAYVSTLQRTAPRELLVEGYGADGVPTNTFYGDGTPIAGDTVAVLRDAYRQEMTAGTLAGWRCADRRQLLASHGRAPYTPPGRSCWRWRKSTSGVMSPADAVAIKQGMDQR